MYHVLSSFFAADCLHQINTSQSNSSEERIRYQPKACLLSASGLRVPPWRTEGYRRIPKVRVNMKTRRCERDPKNERHVKLM